MVRWHEDFFPRLDTEGLDAHEQPVAGQGEDAAIGLL
jgi:hypothetical protein